MASLHVPRLPRVYHYQTAGRTINTEVQSWRTARINHVYLVRNAPGGAHTDRQPQRDLDGSLSRRPVSSNVLNVKSSSAFQSTRVIYASPVDDVRLYSQLHHSLSAVCTHPRDAARNVRRFALSCCNTLNCS